MPHVAIRGPHSQIDLTHLQRPAVVDAEPPLSRSGLVIASHTRWRGASKTRVMTISRSPGVVTVRAPVFGTVVSFSVDVLWARVSPSWIFGAGQPSSRQAGRRGAGSWPPSAGGSARARRWRRRVAAARAAAAGRWASLPREMRPARSSTLRCLEIAGWLIAKGSASSVTDASPEGEPGQDRPPRRIRERGERRVEAVGWQQRAEPVGCITIKLYITAATAGVKAASPATHRLRHERRVRASVSRRVVNPAVLPGRRL